MSEKPSGRWMLWWCGAVLGGVGLGYLMLQSVYIEGAVGMIGFVAAPFVHGAAIAFTISKANASASPGIMGAAILSSILLTILLVAIAGEGAFCIVTAMPIWLAFSIMGMFLGKSLAGLRRGGFMAIGILPLSVLAAYRMELAIPPPSHRIETVMEIDAPPGDVWPLLLNLDQLGEPDTWYFRAGVACPTGTSTDAAPNTRLCHLTTGDMIENITVVRENQEIRWTVSYTPPAVKELNPFSGRQPPHVAGSFKVLEGGFRLQSLPGERTRLSGWTAYQSSLSPDIYWDFWNRMIVRGVQHRVMSEIARRAPVDN